MLGEACVNGVIGPIAMSAKSFATLLRAFASAFTLR